MSGIELSAPPSHALPEYHGMPDEQAQIESELAKVEALWLPPRAESFSYKATLPFNIGYLTASERDAFTDNSALEKLQQSADLGISLTQLSSEFPDLVKKTSDDAATFGFDPASTRVFLRTYTVRKGESHDGSGGAWHLDEINSIKGSTLKYNVCTNPPTEYYEGPVSIKVKRGKTSDTVHTFDPLNISDVGKEVAASTFAITRALPLTVHRSPIAAEATDRTFLQLIYSK